MGATVNIGGKRKIRIRNKELLEELIKVLSQYDEYYRANSTAVINSAGDNSGDKNSQTMPEGIQEGLAESRKTVPFGSPGFGSSNTAGNIISADFINAVQSFFNGMDTGGAESKGKNESSENRVNISFESSAGPASSFEAAVNYPDAAEKKSGKQKVFLNNILAELNKGVSGYTESTGNAYKKMWEGLISEGKKVKEPWDALWLSLKNSAVKRMGEILKNAVIDEIFSSKLKSGSSGGLLSSIFSAVGGLFTDISSGTSKKITGTNSAGSTIPVLNNYVDVPAGNELVNSFRKYADSAENWQRELRVVNDLFENNRGIKAVQEYLSKIKS